MGRKRLGGLAGLAAIGLSYGCGSPEGRVEDASVENRAAALAFDRDAVIAEVGTALWAFHAADTARNPDGVVALLWPEYTMYGDGTKIGYEDAVAGSRSFLPSLQLFHTEWSEVDIIPLGENAAVTTFQFRDSIVANDGSLSRARGPTTFVWQRREGEWRVLVGHADHYPVEP